MHPRKKRVTEAVEVMLNKSLSRLNHLKEEERKALYNEYREWIEIDDNYRAQDEVLYCNYLCN